MGYTAGKIEQEETYECQRWENQTVSTFDHYSRRKMIITVQNAVLQPFETENYSLTLGMNPERVDFIGPNASNSFEVYNQYQVSVRDHDDLSQRYNGTVMETQ